MFTPKRRNAYLGIAIPASLISDSLHLREKTIKAGIIARAAAIFRVDEVIIYIDKHGVEREGELISTILSYCETPQYLRRHIYAFSTLLKYAGLLPPLKIPSHTVPTKIDDIKDECFREGVVTKVEKNISWVDIGLGEYYSIPSKLCKGDRVTIKCYKKDGKLNISLSSKDEVNIYWGYKVQYNYDTITRVVEKFNADLIIATSRYGNPINKVVNNLSEKIRKSRRVLVLFGAPKEGLFEICEKFNIKLEDVADYIINFIPFQGCETIRTEEAVISTLSILNALFDF
ncbi:MAG: putative RNA uridine N3 methyltransferase [Candidatus Methanomethylicia archaeon]